MAKRLITYSRNAVFTNVKKEVTEYFLNKAKPITLFFTTQKYNDDVAEFPTVAINYNTGVELGKTLELDDIEGFENNIEVIVFVSQKQGLDLAMEIMEQMAYTYRKLYGISYVGIPIPMPTSNNQTIKIVARFRNAMA